jgi:hypothetical protein
VFWCVVVFGEHANNHCCVLSAGEPAVLYILVFLLSFLAGIPAQFILILVLITGYASKAMAMNVLMKLNALWVL